jgi:hypothetical protein
MCIAIFKPKNKKIKEQTFRNSFIWHQDGAGFLVHDSKRNKLIVKKGFFTVEEFLEAYAPYENQSCVIHFRKATHGEKDAENCHPFLINKNLGFVHNGILSDIRQWDKKKSDTWHFGESVFKPMIKKYNDIWMFPTFRFLVEESIGKGNKFIMMNNKGDVKIFNEKIGFWDNGCWFSNSTYLYDFKDLDPNLENAEGIMA